MGLVGFGVCVRSLICATRVLGCTPAMLLLLELDGELDDSESFEIESSSSLDDCERPPLERGAYIVVSTSIVLPFLVTIR
jgi:hypothetical protein